MIFAVLQLIVVIIWSGPSLLRAWHARVWEWLSFLCAVVALALAGVLTNTIWPGALAGGLLICTGPLADESLRRYRLAMEREDFPGMLRWARVTATLRPFAEVQALPGRVAINEHLHYRRLGPAIELLKPYEHRSFVRYSWFIGQLHRCQERWLELRATCERVFNSNEMVTLPATYTYHFMSFGELNQHQALIQAFSSFWPLIEPHEKNYRDYCFLMLFAFTGQSNQIQIMDADFREFIGTDDYEYWLATALHIAGDASGAEELWAPMRQVGDEVWREQLARRPQRLARFDRAALGDEARGLLEELERRWVAVPALADPR